MPKRIDQQLKAAISAYTIYKTTLEEIEQINSQLINELSQTEYKVDPEDVENKIINPLASWIEHIDRTKQIIDGEQKKLKDLEKQLRPLEGPV